MFRRNCLVVIFICFGEVGRAVSSQTWQHTMMKWSLRVQVKTLRPYYRDQAFPYSSKIYLDMTKSGISGTLLSSFNRSTNHSPNNCFLSAKTSMFIHTLLIQPKSCWRAEIDTKPPKRRPLVSVELHILSTCRMPLSLQYKAAFDNKPQMSGFNSRFSLSFSSMVSNPRVPALIVHMNKTQA